MSRPLGRKLNFGQTATGTILAAFSPALPESVVTLVATAFGDHDAQKENGVRLVVYGPRLGRGRHALVEMNSRRLSRDQAWFLGIFVCKIALRLIASAIKP